MCVCVCVCVCVRVRVRERECVVVCVRDKATASRALHTRVYGRPTSNTATLRIHSDELKNKMIIIL